MWPEIWSCSHANKTDKILFDTKQITVIGQLRLNNLVSRLVTDILFLDNICNICNENVLQSSTKLKKNINSLKHKIFIFYSIIQPYVF